MSEEGVVFALVVVGAIITVTVALWWRDRLGEIEQVIENGRTALAGGDFDLAISHFNEALRLENKNAHAVGLRGHALYKKKEYRRAIEDFSRAIGLNPTIDWFYILRGDVLADAGHIEEAIANYSDAIRLKPNDGEARRKREAAYARLACMKFNPAAPSGAAPALGLLPPAPMPTLESSPQSQDSVQDPLASVQDRVVNPVGLLSFVFGLLSVFLYIIWPIPLAAAVLGGVGWGTFNERKHKGKWLAIAGLALGVLYTIMFFAEMGKR